MRALAIVVPVVGLALLMTREEGQGAGAPAEVRAGSPAGLPGGPRLLGRRVPAPRAPVPAAEPAAKRAAQPRENADPFIEGVVVQPDGTPVGDAALTLSRPDGGCCSRARRPPATTHGRTDAAGGFRLELPSGRLPAPFATLSLDDALEARILVSLPRGEPLRWEVSAHRIRVRVEGEAAGVAAGTVVRARGWSAKTTWHDIDAGAEPTSSRVLGRHREGGPRDLLAPEGSRWRLEAADPEGGRLPHQVRVEVPWRPGGESVVWLRP